MKCTFGYRLTVNQVLDHLEEEDFFTATVFVTPPGNGQESDEDSAEEEEGDVNNLNRNQLGAQAEAEYMQVRAHGHEYRRIGGKKNSLNYLLKFVFQNFVKR